MGGKKKKTFLSLGRRITLIQSCLLFIPSYFLSLYKISSSVATRIEKMQKDFLWSGFREGKRDHPFSWIQVCKLKEEGLGFKGTSLRNMALLGNLLWRFPMESIVL